MKTSTIGNRSQTGTMKQGTSVFLKTFKGVIGMLLLLVALAIIPNQSNAQFMQQGPKLNATDVIGAARQGVAVSLSADGNTAIVGSQVDNSGIGAATIWTRSGGVWTELQKIVPTDEIGTPEFGLSVAMSADGNTVAIGGILDHEYTYNNEPNNFVGAVWVYVNTIGGWTEQEKLIGQGYGVTPEQGTSVAISANGNTIIEGGYMDNYGEGASWVFQRTGSTWDAGTKLYFPYYNYNTLTYQGCSVSISADGTRVVIGAYNYDYGTGTAFMWRYNGSSWSEFDNVEDYSYTSNPNNTLQYFQGSAVAMSGDGNTIVVTSKALDGTEDAAFTWIYDTYWDMYFPQAGMVGTGYIGDPFNGTGYFSPSHVAISYTGDTVVLTSTPDNNEIGAMWMFVHSGNWQDGEWDQLGNKYVGNDYIDQSYQGEGVAMSYDGSTVMVGGFYDNNGVGASWVYVPCTSNNQADAPTVTASQTFMCGSSLTDVELDITSGNLNDASDWQWYTQSCGGTPVGSGTQLFVFPGVTTTYYARGEGSCVVSGPCGSVTITVDNPTATISGATTSCGPETLDGGAGYASYEWQAPNGNPIGNNSETVTAQYLNTYYLTVTDANGCAGTTSLFVNIFQSPTPFISGGPNICTSGTLDAGVGYVDYLWSTGDITEQINVSVSGLYIVTVTDGNGCTGSATININIIPPPTPVISVSNIICGQSATLDAGFWMDYQWNDPLNQTTEQINLTSTDPYIYIVTVTDWNGCTGVSAPLNESMLSSFFPEEFEEGTFPPPCWTESNNTGIPWSQNNGANGPTDAGFQSAMMDFWDVFSGGSEQLTSSLFSPTPAGFGLQFDEAYASNNGADDQLQILYSMDGGNTFNQLVLLDGGDSGPLNTGGDVNSNPFIPSANQWQTMAFALPPGTNMVQFNGLSAEGNDLFIDNVNVLQFCTGTPNPGNIATTLVCNTSANLALTGQSTDAGVTLQWQTSPDGVNFTDIPGAANPTYSTPVISSPTYYQVLVTCVGSGQFATSNMVTVEPPPTPSIYSYYSTTFCDGNYDLLYAWDQNENNYPVYQWSTGDVTPYLYVYGPSGIYSVTVTDNIGCTAATSIPIIDNPNPTTTITSNGPTTFCTGGNVTLDAGAGFQGYQWDDINNSMTETINVTTSGTYDVTVTDNNGCTTAATQVVTVTTTLNPVITANGATTFCQGGSVSLDAGAGYASYNWSTTDITESITESSNGTYSVTVSDGTGCTGIASQTVTVNPNPTVTAGDVSGCAGTNITLLGSPNGGNWNVPNPYSNVAGNYSYTYSYTDGNGCSGNATSNITVNANPNVTAGDVSGCAGTNITLLGSPNGGTWNVPNPYSNVAGNYSYTYSYTDGNGCSGNATSNITVNANPNVTAGDVSGCAGTNITLLGSPNGGTWNVPNPYSNVAGNYSYTYSYTDGNGCSGNATSNITVNANPTVTAGDVSGCAGTNITLLGSPNGGTWNVPNPYSNVAGNYSYTYSYTDGNGCSGNATSNITVNANPNVTAGDVSGCAGTNITLLGSPNGGTWNVPNPYSNVAGNYSYTYSYTDGNGCSGNATSNITVNANPNVTGGDVSGCAGTNITLLGSPNGGTWNVPNPYSNVAGNYSYIYSYTDGNGCSGNATSNITVNANPNVTAGDVSGCAGTNITLLGSPNGGNWNVPNPYSNVAGNYSYTYSYTDGNGCSGNATSNITVYANPTPIITPNGPTTFNQGGNVTLDAGVYSSYLWSTNAITETINVTAGGTYFVTVTNANGCTGVTSIVVTVNVNLTPVITANGPTTFCSGNSVLLSTGAYSLYNWSNGANTQSITVSTGGTYKVTVTDGFGNTGVATQIVTVNPSPSPVITGPTSVCNGGQITLTTGSFNTYLWSTNAVTQSINVTAPGTYKVTVTNANGCTGVASQIVVQTALANPVITGPTSACSGTPVTLGLTNTYTTYLWSTNAVTPTISVSTTGNYGVTVTNGACSGSTHLSVTILAAPVPTIIPTLNNYCSGNSSAILSVGTFHTYLWNTNSVAQSITVPPANPGTYSVTVTSTNGCTGIASYVLSTSCLIPATLPVTNLAATSATANWAQPSCVYGYTIRISKHNANAWTNFTIAPNSHYTFSQLAHNTSYDWQVQTNCNAAGTINSGFSATQTFTTLARLESGETDNIDYAFNIYPNPTNDHATVAFTTGSEDNYNIRLIDVTGRIIQATNYTSVIGENQYQLNLSQVAKGVYTVILQNGTTLLQSKIVVQ